MLHFWLLFYLSEGLIFIPPNNLVFARANAGVGGRGVGGPRGKRTLLCLLEFKFLANPVLSLVEKLANKSRIASRECMSYLETFRSTVFKIQQQTKNGCRKNMATQ